MTPSQVTRTIELSLQTLWPLFIIGPPGVGKTALVSEITQRHDLDLYDLRLPQLDSVDLRGLPMVLKVIREGRVTDELSTDVVSGGDYETRWIPPTFLPRKGGKRAVLFLDELSAALPAVQVAAYQLIQERRLGDYRLPDDCLVIGAGNRMQDKAVVNRMSSALCNKMVMVQFEASVNDWSQWAIRAGIEPEIISCVRSQPSLLFNFEPSKWQDGTNFASPRSWHTLDKHIKACPQIFGLGKSVQNTATAEQGSMSCWELELIQGIIGPAAGMAFFLHLQHYIKLPTPQEIIADPDGAMVPDNASARHCVSAALIRSIDKQTFGPILQYLRRLELEFQYYVAMSAITQAKEKRGPDLSGHPAWHKFVSENKTLFGLA